MRINFSVAVLLLLFPVAAIAQSGAMPESVVSDTPAGVLAIAAEDDTSLMWLAHVWSGGQTEAQCRNTAPHGMPLVPGERYCELLPGTSGIVGLQTSVGDTVTMVTWTRLTSGHEDAQAITDSLDVMLRGHGLAGRACHREPTDGLAMVWESPELLVYLSRITLPGELPKLVTLAVDDPEAFPEAFCRPQEQEHAHVP